jgi:hypothetical protein
VTGIIDIDPRAHRIFKVAKPAIANTIEMIQNLMTICGSVQPFCSKW